MNEAQREKLQLIVPFLIWAGILLFAYGFAYKNQSVMIGGLFVLGFTLPVQAIFSLINLKQWQINDVKTKLAYWGEVFFAVGQIIFGFLAIIGAIADLTSNYLTSGSFWQQVSQYPLLFAFSFGVFCSFVGIAQILAHVQPEGEKLSDKLGSFKGILEGLFYLLVGLFFIGLIVFVKLF